LSALPDTSAVAIATLQRPSRPRVHLAFLDGLRGLAALCVALHHIHQFVLLPQESRLPWAVRYGVSWLAPWGHLSVDVFIVLSGFSLMLPVARAGDWRLPGGLVEFFKRRARRILPAYYASLALTLLVVATVPFMRAGKGDFWDDYFPMFEVKQLLSHLLLVQNLRLHWITKINGVTWSLATEWQIYFIFALILLPVWRRLGALACLGVAFILGLAPGFAAYSVPGFKVPMFASYWYIGEFAFGMVAATIASRAPADRARRQRWCTVSELGFVAAVAAIVVNHTVVANLISNPLYLHFHRAFTITEIFCGIATACILVSCSLRRGAASSGAGRTPRQAGDWLLALLESRWAVALGGFSYSLYLVHFLTMAFLIRMLAPQDHSWVALVLFSGLCVPAMLVASYGFFILFERPFLKVTPARRGQPLLEGVSPEARTEPPRRPGSDR
jgi:peptidoglycan/LPS O-acetylase OafA/YrhL